jgi:hypothetical protein
LTISGKFKEPETMTREAKEKLQQDLARIFGCDPGELAGQRVGDALEDADRIPGVDVWWGFRTEAELDETF